MSECDAKCTNCLNYYLNYRDCNENTVIINGSQLNSMLLGLSVACHESLEDDDVANEIANTISKIFPSPKFDECFDDIKFKITKL